MVCLDVFNLLKNNVLNSFNEALLNFFYEEYFNYVYHSVNRGNFFESEN